MSCGRTTRSVGVALLVVVALMCASVAEAQNGTASLPLRVACRQGQAPFNYWDASVPEGQRRCDGLLGELFYMIMDRAKLSYNMSFINTGNLDPLVQLTLDTSNRSTSVYDMIVSFHTVTPARLRLYTFTVTALRSDDTLTLSGSYRKGQTSLVESVVRRSVLYIFTVFAVLFAGMGVVIYVFEHLTEDGDMLEEPPWRRALWALEMGVETLITSSTSNFVSHPVTRLLRSCLAVAGIFMMGVLAGAITSQLTTAGGADLQPSPSDIRGTNLALSSSVLQPFLQSLRVGVTNVTIFGDIESFARRWYQGLEPTHDGFATSTTIARFLQNKYASMASSPKPIMSAPYLSSSIAELKAMPVSFNVPYGVAVANINGQFQAIRDDGNYSLLIAKYIPTAPEPPSSDIAIDDATYRAVVICVAVFYGVAILAAGVAFVVQKVTLSDTNGAPDVEADPSPHRQRAPSRRPSMTHVHYDMHDLMDGDLAWGSRLARSVTGPSAAWLDSLTAACHDAIPSAAS